MGLNGMQWGGWGEVSSHVIGSDAVDWGAVRKTAIRCSGMKSGVGCGAVG